MNQLPDPSRSRHANIFHTLPGFGYLPAPSKFKEYLTNASQADFNPRWRHERRENKEGLKFPRSDAKLVLDCLHPRLKRSASVLIFGEGGHFARGWKDVLLAVMVMRPLLIAHKEGQWGAKTLFKN